MNRFCHFLSTGMVALAACGEPTSEVASPGATAPAGEAALTVVYTAHGEGEIEPCG
ncbi:MAG: hypothetical protein KC912_07420 [Proteobacteria bacterium]|nr:hypothetical protein [Pseudomonadota bacterium]